MIWLILVGVFCLIFYYKAVQPLSYWKDRGVVHTKPWPLIGNSYYLIFQNTSSVDYIYDLYKEFSNERYFGIHQFLKPTLFINDLDLIKMITVKDYDYFIDHNSIVAEEPLMDRSLFNLKGERWRDMRTTLSPSFTSGKIKMMFSFISKCAEEFTNYFENQRKNLIKVEMKDAFTRFTNDSIASAIFGFHCNSFQDKNNEFYTMGKQATSFSRFKMMVFILFNVYPTMAKVFKLQLVPAVVKTYFRYIIKDTIHKRENEGLIRLDMVHLLLMARKGTSASDESGILDASFAALNEFKILKSKKRHKIELSDEDIIAQAILLFVAGFDTSATLMSFISYELAMNKHIQKKLQAEIDETLNKCNGKLTYEAINKMKYMDMVVSETLRKWPPGFVLDRLCVKDYLIEPVNAWEKPLLVEKGVVIQIPVIGIHRDPKFFPNPDTFDPERFNDENIHSIEQLAYLPFGSGPRGCIASRFGLMENKVIIFHVLSKFYIQKINKTPNSIKIAKKSLSLDPEEGFWLGLRRREAV